MKATIKLKSFPNHKGIPGHQGGSLPENRNTGLPVGSRTSEGKSTLFVYNLPGGDKVEVVPVTKIGEKKYRLRVRSMRGTDVIDDFDTIMAANKAGNKYVRQLLREGNL